MGGSDRWKGGYGTARAVTQQSGIDRVRNKMRHIRIGVIWVLDGRGGGHERMVRNPADNLTETREGLA